MARETKTIQNTRWCRRFLPNTSKRKDASEIWQVEKAGNDSNSRLSAGKESMQRNYLFLPFCAACRAVRSPSAINWLALTSCTILTNCLNAIIGAETPVTIHGNELSILLARASSNAPALQGLGEKAVGLRVGRVSGLRG